MSRRRKGNDIHGILLLDKPAGFSSNQAVQKMRWLFQARKAGHTGSLDPFATGMLPICFGEASKTAGFMLDATKSYQAVARMGQKTATGDIEGEIVEQSPVPELTPEILESVFSRFRGPIEQVPPMYSALKHQGERLYKLAREGKEIERKARSVVIHLLELVSWQPPLLEFRVTCSKGTYIRTLAEDIAKALGSCAHLASLRRAQVGLFEERDMVSLETVQLAAEEGRHLDLLLPVDSGLADWPEVVLDDEGETKFKHGNPAPVADITGGAVRVYGPQNRLLGLGEARSDRMVYPKRVFVW
jgi:tRNA pseudouridine55 synthase